MTEPEKNTEEIIYEAAKSEFIEKGFDGTRMQGIAAKAGINKALLHYYFRTKEKLFDAIFEKVFRAFMPQVFEAIESDKPLEYKIEVFVSSYLTLIIENPHIPSFILHELNRNPDRLSGLFGNVMAVMKDRGYNKFAETIRREIEAGTIREITPEQLFVNIIGLCIFPVVARPIIQTVLFQNDRKQYNLFLESRKKEVASFIIHSIRIPQEQNNKSR